MIYDLWWNYIYILVIWILSLSSSRDRIEIGTRVTGSEYTRSLSFTRFCTASALALLYKFIGYSRLRYGTSGWNRHRSTSIRLFYI